MRVHTEVDMTMYPLVTEDHAAERTSVLVPQPQARIHSAPVQTVSEGPLRRSGLRTVLKRRFMSILLGFLAVVSIAGGISFVLPPRYESSASFLIEEATAPSPTMAALSVLERLGHARSAETEIALLRSSRVVEPVVDRLDLNVTAKTPDGPARPADVLRDFTASLSAVPGTYTVTATGTGSYRIGWPGAASTRSEFPAGSRVAAGGMVFTLPEANGIGSIELEVAPFGRVVERVQRRMQVRPADKNAEVILLTCDGRTAADAQRLCSGLTDSYLTLRATLQRAEASTAATFLAAQAREVGKRLALTEDSLRRYARATQSIALDVQARDVVARLIDVKAQREMLAAERNALASLVAEIENGGNGTVDYRRLASFPSFMKSQSQVISNLLETLVQLENRYSDLAVRRSDQNPELVAVSQRLNEIQGQLQALASTYVQGLGSQVASLDQELLRSGADLQAIPGQEVESARFRREISLQEEAYRFLQTRLHEAEVAQAVNMPSVRIIDRPTLPFKLAFPNIPLNLGLAGVLGLGFGLMLALYREYSDTRIYERQEVEQALGVPVLGMVGLLHDSGPVSATRALRGKGTSLVVQARRVRERELAWESFHALVTEIRSARGTSPDGKPRSIAVTSTSRGEGKTHVACNFAIGWASYPARTLIIDADLRGGAVSRYFNLEKRSPGLTDVLTGTVGLDEAIRVVDVAPGTQVHVLAAGTYPDRSAEVIDTAALDQLLRDAESRFDLVIVDTPPLNVLSDAASVAARVDAVLVAVRGGQTDRNALGLTLHRIGRLGGHVQGVVLNAVELPDYYVRYSKLTV